MPHRITLTLAHSPDPDDVFMWWPLTGKLDARLSRDAAEHGEAVGAGHAASLSEPVIDTSPFVFRALPLDIEVLNRRAMERGDLEITALSARCWSNVRDRYVITGCGASFGDGFGPKVVVRDGDVRLRTIVDAAKPGVRFAIPGRRTTAFLMLGMLLGDRVTREPESFIEMPFDHIIGAVASGKVDAGLVIHEGQLTFGDAGLRLLADVGAWWKEKTGLKLPLGVNAIRRDLDAIHGPGTVMHIAEFLRRSVEYSMARWHDSVAYTMPFAEENVRRGGGESPTIERVDRYCRMYVSHETREMGDKGREAIRRLLAEGASAGLCEAIDRVETV